MHENVLHKIKDVISEEEIVELIKKLVGIPSHNGIQNQEAKVAECIYRIFTKEGIDCEIIPVEQGRCNVVGKIRGTGNGKALLLTGHTDTVPPYDMENPYTVKKAGNRLIGRGTVDMKGPLACMIYSMIAIKRAGIKLRGDIIFAGVIDEEEKSLGTIDLIERGIRADAAVVGEPTGMDICVAHRGLEWFEFHFSGKTVHGGKQNEGINAIRKASDFIQNAEKKLLPKIKSETHYLIGSSSMNYGTINGGTQPSTVAGECALSVDRRWVPGIKYDDVVKGYQDLINDMEKNDEEFKCIFKVVDSSIMKEGYVHEAMETDINHPIIEIIKSSTNMVCEKAPEITYFPAWSDGGLLSSYAQIPTVVFGPGDLESAHSKDEYLDIDIIKPSSLIYSLTAVEFCR